MESKIEQVEVGSGPFASKLYRQYRAGRIYETVEEWLPWRSNT
jgi:hypothetical protein